MDRRKINIISILAISGLFVISYSTFLKDDLSTFLSLRHKRSSLKEEIKRDTYTVITAKNKITEVLSLEQELKEHQLLLTREERIPYFLNYISSLARQNKVEIISIEPRETVEDSLLTKAAFAAEIRGGFPSIYNFLYHLEEDWKGVKIETLSIARGPDNNNVNVRLALLVLSIHGGTNLKNPFVSAPYGRMERPAVKSEAVPKSRGVEKREDIVKDLKLKGILLDEEYPVALVGNRIVKVGDSIGDFVVKDITSKGVILLKGDQAIQLSVE